MVEVRAGKRQFDRLRPSRHGNEPNARDRALEAVRFGAQQREVPSASRRIAGGRLANSMQASSSSVFTLQSPSAAARSPI